MPCPRCHSNKLWDDNLAWGCCDCPWFSTGDVRNTSDSRDYFPQDGEGPKPLTPKDD